MRKKLLLLVLAFTVGIALMGCTGQSGTPSVIGSMMQKVKEQNESVTQPSRNNKSVETVENVTEDTVVTEVEVSENKGPSAAYHEPSTY